MEEDVEGLNLGPGEGNGLFAEEDGAEGGLGYRQLRVCHRDPSRIPARQNRGLAASKQVEINGFGGKLKRDVVVEVKLELVPQQHLDTCRHKLQRLGKEYAAECIPPP